MPFFMLEKLQLLSPEQGEISQGNAEQTSEG